MVRKFTKKLDELYVKENLELLETLEIIGHKSEMKKDRIALTADYIYQQLETGNLLSNAFKTCPYINFNDVYVSFIALSEKTGDLRAAISYLSEKYERNYRNKMKLIEVSIYPAFVIILSALSGFMLISYTQNNIYEFLKTVALVIAICIGIYSGIIKAMWEEPLYEAFMVVDFLLKAGIGISEAIGCAVNLLGRNSRLGALFEASREKLEFGMNLQNSLQIGKKYEEGFYFADKAGRKTEVFGKMAVWINTRYERRQKICMGLVEPVFILVAGFFLFFLILKFFLPFLTEINFG